jgi:hypothetical protein
MSVVSRPSLLPSSLRVPWLTVRLAWLIIVAGRVVGVVIGVVAACTVCLVHGSA